jgi:putative nucleotidyltransferase with HDIG domain
MYGALEASMVVDEMRELREEVASLRARLEEQSREAAAKERQLERYAADLSETFKRERARTQELNRSYAATVRALANAVEARDAYTGKHAERVAAYGLLLAEAVGLASVDKQELEFGFLLHDIGKVAVPDAILFKPDKLAAEEREVIETHPVRGAEILRDIDFLADARDVVRHHHERWDGSGYPDGLSGEEIPLTARVFAIADVLDALTTDRPYRRAGTFAQAREEIVSSAGTQFDPSLIEVYGAISDETFAVLRDQLS